MIYSVSELLHRETGKTISFDFSEDLELEGLNIKGPITGEINLIRVEEGISAQVENIDLNLIFQCGKCLEDYEMKIHIDGFERVFHEKKVENASDICGFHLIDMKKQKIDLKEPLRQEINLHFPPNSVCSNQCKGLCRNCGVNLNKKTCSCSDNLSDPESQNRPFSNLKDLIKR